MKNYLSLIFIIALNSATSLINQITIAFYFGAGAELDILNIAMALPNAVMSLSIGGLNLVLIPLFASAKQDGISVKKMAVFFEKKMLIGCGVTMIVLTIIQLLIYKNNIPKELFPKFIQITILSNLVLFITLLNSVYISWANVEKKYILTSFGGSFLNILSIISCVFLHQYIGVIVLTCSLLFGSFFLILFLRVSLSKINYAKQNKPFEIPKLGLPILASVISIIPFSFPSFVDSYLLSSSLKGFASYAAYATKLMTVLGVLIIQPLNLLLFPLFSEMIHNKEIKQLGKLITNTVYFTFLTCFLIIFIVDNFFTDIIRLVFRHGSFKENDVINLMLLLKLYVWGLAGMTLMNIINRLLSSLNENKFQIILGIIFIPFYFIIAKYFFNSYHYLAVGIAYGVTWTLFIITALLYVYSINWTIKTLFDYKLIFFSFFLFLISYICSQYREAYILYILIFSIGSVFFLLKIMQFHKTYENKNNT